MLSGLILALLLIALYYNHRSNQRRRDAVKNLQGPYCIPNVGAVNLFFQIDLKNFMNVGQQLYKKYGSCVPVWVFNRLIILSMDVEMNEQLLANTQHTVKHPVYKILGKWLGNGLLISDGHTWHQRRKIITPAFHFKILEQFVEVFDQQSTICLERLATKADGRTPFDVYPFICHAALDIIAETAMGTKIHAQSDKGTAYARAVTEVTALLAWRFLSVYLHVEWIFTLLHPLLKLRQTKLIRSMHEFTIKIIEERRSQLAAAESAKDTREKLHDDDELEVLGAKKRMALLDVLLQATIDGKPLANDEIREEVDTFMFEGHDTTTSAICHSLYLLARHAQIQTKLREEVLSVLGADRTRPISLRDLNELKYMECVIKETLRIYPAVPLVARKIEQDFKYTHTKFGDGIIPAGSEILVSLIGVMLDPVNFEQPYSFIPERHESGETSGAFALIPFSAGPRNCIGQKFAVLEIKITLAKIVRNFELLPLGETLKSELNIVLRSSNGFQLGLRKI